ncbi:MAG: SDR family oxidoreductase [Alphaproteobacteria bacterium]|nr:SDR family oxidoreductase [Alphaproteobacteria bacterium]
MTAVLVTGAASGMGLATAKLLRGQGHKVAALDIEGNALHAALPAGPTLLPVVADIADPDACARAVETVTGRFGGLAALVHFAGVHSAATWDTLTPAEWDRTHAVNLKGSFFLAQAAARPMVAARLGRIVLIGSDSVLTGGIGQGAGGPAYISAKAGIIGLTRSLARALAPHGVTVNAISPGLIRTPMLDGFPAEAQAAALAHIPAARFGTPEDVGNVAAFLISDAAAYVTGEIVEVNGGLRFA